MHIVPPLSPSQPAIADEKISCWGKEPSRSSMLSLLQVAFFFSFVFSLYFVQVMRREDRNQPQYRNNTITTASSRNRARVYLCECCKFATQALFSVQVMALGSSTNREVNMTAGEVLFLETKLAVSSPLLLTATWPPRNTNNKQRSFCF